MTAYTYDAHVQCTVSPTLTPPQALVNVPTSETYTFLIACQRAWKETGVDDPNKVLIFR